MAEDTRPRELEKTAEFTGRVVLGRDANLDEGLFIEIEKGSMNSHEYWLKDPRSWLRIPSIVEGILARGHYREGDEVRLVMTYKIIPKE